MNPRVERLIRKAWALADAGRLDLAREQVAKAEALLGSADPLDLEVGVMLFKGADHEGALARFERVTVHSPEDPVGFVNGAKAALGLSQPERALELCEQGIAAHPEHLGLWMTAGQTELALESFEGALGRFERAIVLKARSGTAWRFRAEALRRLDRIDEALAAISESCALEPGRPDAFWERARCLRAAGRLEDAWGYLLDAVRLRKEDASSELLADVGDCALELKRSGDAARVAEKLIARDKDDARGWRLKGRALAAAGDEARGAACVGTACMIEEDLEQALTELKRSVELSPKYTAAWCNLAVVLERMDRLDDALRCYDEAIHHDKRAAVCWHNKGVLLLDRLDRAEDATACFREEVRLDHRRWFELAPEVRKLLGSP